MDFTTQRGAEELAGGSVLAWVAGEEAPGAAALPLFGGPEAPWPMGPGVLAAPALPETPSWPEVPEQATTAMAVKVSAINVTSVPSGFRIPHLRAKNKVSS
jgi:hypothetical protein